MKFSDQLSSLTADVFANASNEYAAAVEATTKVIQDSGILRSALRAREMGPVYRLPAAMQMEFQKKGLLLPVINGDDSWELPIPATYLVGQDGGALLDQAGTA